MVVGDDGGPESNAVELVDSTANDLWMKGASVLVPPYQATALALICENSSALRPNIDAYVTNIDSYGHTFRPVIDLDASDVDAKIHDAIAFEEKREPTTGEVTKRKESLRREMADERQRLEAFFQYCTYDIQFSGPEGLRGLTRMDLEIVGNAYWEVLRNNLGDVAGFNRLPAVSMYMTVVDRERVEIQEKRKRSLLSVESIPVRKRFRRYVQKFDNSTLHVYFKEFGDPRVVSSKTGKAYATPEELVKEEPEVFAATEVIAFKISSPRCDYGVPRWVGVLLAVLGTRQAEEVNFMYFENKSIPPMAVLVQGGRLSEDSVKRIEEHLDSKIKGKKNFHKVLILEADAAQTTAMNASASDVDTGRMRIVLQPLTEAQQKDGLFLDYDERNADKVGQSFRLPRLLRGDVRDFNRSTAVAALDFAEVQVFNPLRQQFDWVMNKLMLTVLDARYHDFVSNAATIRDPEALSLMIKNLMEANALTPEEGRELAEGVFQRQFIKIDAPWTKQPIGITVSGANAALAKPGAGKQGQGAGALSVTGAGPTQDAVGAGQDAVRAKALAKSIETLHGLMVKGEREEFEGREEEIIKVPADVFHSFFR